MDKQEITNRLNQLPDAYREFILGGLPQIISETFSETHGFDNDQRIVFEDGFTLYLLFFFTEKDFISFIVENLNLKEKPARLLVKGLQLALPKEVYSFINDTNELIENKSANIATEIAETESQIKSLNTIRTMTGDQQSNSSQNETTYPSVQDDILKQKNNPTPPSSPRWESGS